LIELDYRFSWETWWKATFPLVFINAERGAGNTGYRNAGYVRGIFAAPMAATRSQMGHRYG
jgi:hypothetical protein